MFSNNFLSNLFLLLILSVAMFFGLQPFSEILPIDGIGRDFIAASIGAILVALVTGIFLEKRSLLEQKKAKDDEIFKARLKVYEEFLTEFFSMLKDNEIKDDEIDKLQSINERIFAYGGRKAGEQIKSLMEQVKRTAKEAGDEKIDGGTKETLTDKMHKISNGVFRQDLLGEDISTNSTEKPVHSNIDSKQLEKNQNKKHRGTNKIMFAGNPLTKTKFVEEVFTKLLEENSFTIEKLKNDYASNDRMEECGLNKHEQEHFEGWRSQPIWLLFKQAEELKKRSAEANWQRYIMEPKIKVEKEEIVVRRGQNSDSVSGLIKLLPVEFKKKYKINDHV